MKQYLLSLVFSFSTALSASNAPVPYQWGEYKPSAVAKNRVIIVDWNSKEGRRRLTRSGRHHADFFQMAHTYQPQVNPVYATVASAVIVLNALRLPKHTIPSQDEGEIHRPESMGGGVIPYPAYSQSNFLNAETDKIKARDVILLKTPAGEVDGKPKFKPGLGLADLQKMLTVVYHAKATVTYARAEAKAKDGVTAFRETAKKVLSDQTSFLLANFKGDVLGASTEGTVSPLAAYDDATDSVLILDVTGHKNPWYWVPLPALYESMHTQYDGDYRGYIVIED
jgi:hypothetical protein